MLLAVRISSYGCTWEVRRALEKLELLSAAPWGTLTHFSRSPNFPRASITRYTHEQILKLEVDTRNWLLLPCKMIQHSYQEMFVELESTGKLKDKNRIQSTGWESSVVAWRTISPFHSHDHISNSPYCLSYNSHDVILENLVLDQLISPNWYFSLFSSLVCLMSFQNSV